MIKSLTLAILISLLSHAVCQEQDVAPVIYAVEGKSVELPCPMPGTTELLLWRFHKNGTNYDTDAAQVYVGSMPAIFTPFNSPVDRAKMEGGSLVINEIYHTEEGEYWCEITSRNVPTTKSRKYPVHVYVEPQEPKVTPLRNRTLTELQATPVARCTSQGGKPATKLTWMNGTIPMTGSQPVVKVNAFKSYLNDSDLDLLMTPTRFDHNRVFSCIVEHPSYEAPKILNYSVLVRHHPVNIRVWANLTSLMVYCKADSYPNPTYHWTMPGSLTGFTGPSLYVPDMFSLPGGGRFECTAENGLPPNITARVLVDELRYPLGKPGLAGLAWWIWAIIAGGVFVIVVIIIVVVCCKKCRNSDKSEASIVYKKPILKSSEDETRAQPPASLPINTQYRDTREDSFDSRTPTPTNEYKRALIGGVYGDQPHEVAIVPSEHVRRSMENLYDGDRRASHEQLDMVASHISTLNKSWDQLSKSRQALNEAQDELQHMNTGLNKSREQLYRSREAVNHDDGQNYPYIDEDTRQPDYYDHHESQGNHRQPPPAYDYDSYRHGSQDHGNYSDGPQYDSRYNTDQGYQDYERDDGRRDYSRGDSRNYGRANYDDNYTQQDYRHDDYDERARDYYDRGSNPRMI